MFVSNHVRLFKQQERWTVVWAFSYTIKKKMMYLFLKPFLSHVPSFFMKRRQGQYILKTPQYRMCPSEAPCLDSQPMSIISLGPSPASGGPSSVRPAPRRSKTPKKQQPKDIPIQIFAAPPPPTTAPPPPPPPPPPLPVLLVPPENGSGLGARISGGALI